MCQFSKAIGVEKGSGRAYHEKVGTIGRAALREIAETKQKDLNAASVEAAMKIIEGTARSMGVVTVPPPLPRRRRWSAHAATACCPLGASFCSSDATPS